MFTKYVGGQSTEYGELKNAVLLGAGNPASYVPSTGDMVANPAPGDYIAAITPAFTLSNNYQVQFRPSAVDDIRAGATSGMQSGWSAAWYYAGTLGIQSVVQNAAGTGMTPGTTVPLVFTGGNGTGAAGTLTVLTATTFSLVLTASGSGYTSTPTVTVSGTGGTPPTLTASVFPAYGPVASGVNLSAELIQIQALVTNR